MFTLMHISDLHRSKLHPITNDELLSCLTADSLRYQSEEPPIALPNAIIISGDLVSGLPLKSSEYPTALKDQYSEALDFLIRLTNTFVNGDRSKVVIAPGNHDVDWDKALNAMSVINQDNEKIRELISQPNTPYRWSWLDLKLFRITNYEIYEDRFKYFCDLYNEFYKEANLAYPVDPEQDWNIFEMDEGKILVCVFNSCVEVDCFNPTAYIPTQAISQSHLATNNRDYSLKIAVWHHDIKGDPRRSDYIGTDIIQLMIDRGYRLGMHGHRHKADASPVKLYLSSGKHEMGIISTGSLCAANNQLPAGVTRQYNMVEVDSEYTKARVHVREMRVPEIFGPGRFSELDGWSFTDVAWSPAPKNMLVNTGRGGGFEVVLAEQAEKLMSQVKYKDAALHLMAAKDRLGSYGRKLLLEALFRDQQWENLITEIREPTNSDELTKMTVALIAQKKWKDGKELLRIAKNSGQFPHILLTELEARLKAEKGISDERT